MLLFSLVTPVYSLYFCIVLFTRFNKLNDDDDDENYYDYDELLPRYVCTRAGFMRPDNKKPMQRCNLSVRPFILLSSACFVPGAYGFMTRC